MGLSKSVYHIKPYCTIDWCKDRSSEGIRQLKLNIFIQKKHYGIILALDVDGKTRVGRSSIASYVGTLGQKLLISATNSKLNYAIE